MTKRKLIGGIVAMMMILSSMPYASAVTPTEQVYVESAPIATELAIPKSVRLLAIGKPRKTFTCRHFLAQALHKAGFKGNGLRIAWAIAMRESGGRANAISSTGDYGVFQFNRAAHSKQPWWDTAKMLNRKYNIMIAFHVSQKGKTFYPWDIDGNGKHKGNYTSKGVYNKYLSWYEKYPEYCMI